jgi:serine protease Do
LLLFAASAIAQPVPRQQAPAGDPLVRMNESIDALTKKVWPSVVQILVSSLVLRRARRAAPPSSGRQQSFGSGFVIEDGYIMTNAHVINGARRIQIVLPSDNADGTLADGVIGQDETRDRADRRRHHRTGSGAVEGRGIETARTALRDVLDGASGRDGVRVRQPQRLRNSLTHGLVSAVARQVTPDSPQIFVQTDAPINPGNSGGPLVNIRGEVVGVNTFIMSQSGGNEGLGFAVPSATARRCFASSGNTGTCASRKSA